MHAGSVRHVITLILVAAVIAPVVVYSATGVAEPRWKASVVVDGVVSGVYAADSIVYAAVSGNGSSHVYAIDPETGGILWGAALDGSYPMLRPLPDKAFAATTTGSGGLLYRVADGEATLIANATIGRPSIRITAATPTASGVLVLAGGKYHVGTGIDVYLAGYTGDEMQWNTTTPAPGDQYLNTISVGVDDTVCAAGPDGNNSAVLVCLSPTGKILKQEAVTGKGKPMALAVYDNTRHALALYDGENTTLIVYTNTGRDEITLDATVITAIAYTSGNKLAMTGATGGAPILIELEYTDAGRLGNVYAIQGIEDLAPLAVASTAQGYLVGGGAGGTPIVVLLDAAIESTGVEQNQTLNENPGNEEVDPLLVASSIMILVSGIILGYVFMKRKRAISKISDDGNRGSAK